MVCGAHGPPSRAAVVTPRRRGTSPGRVGKTFSGEPISKSERTACSQLRPEWCSTVYWPSSRPLPHFSLYGLFASPAAISGQLALLSGILPDSAVEILREQIGRLTANTSKLGLGFIFGLAIALWSANSGMKAIMDALNVVYEEKEKRSFIKLNLVSLAFTLAGLGSCCSLSGLSLFFPLPSTISACITPRTCCCDLHGGRCCSL
jgi:hypothetical protein